MEVVNQPNPSFFGLVFLVPEVGVGGGAVVGGSVVAKAVKKRAFYV